MKAVVIEGPRVAGYRDVEEPTAGPDDVVVLSRSVGLCRTDLEMVTGEFSDPRWVRYPVIPGHEWAGTVAEVGRNVGDVRTGDRVVCEGLIPCNSCPQCRRGQTQWCERIQSVGFSRPGGCAEVVVVPGSVVHVLPSQVSFSSAVLVEPLSVVWHALQKVTPRAAESVGVVGAGAVGCLAIALLKLYSPAEIVAYGLRESELDLARRMGATDVRRADQVRSPAATHDLVAETAGAVAAVDMSMTLARPGGRVLRLGIAGSDKTMSQAADILVTKDLTVVGSLAYTRAAWAGVVDLIRSGLLDPEPIATTNVPVRDFAKVLAEMESGNGPAGRIVLNHEG